MFLLVNYFIEWDLGSHFCFKSFCFFNMMFLCWKKKRDFTKSQKPSSQFCFFLSGPCHPAMSGCLLVDIPTPPEKLWFLASSCNFEQLLFVLQKKCFYDSKHFPDVSCHFQYFSDFGQFLSPPQKLQALHPAVGEPRRHTMLRSILVLVLSFHFQPCFPLNYWMQTERIHTLLFRWGFISFSLHQWLAQTYKDLFALKNKDHLDFIVWMEHWSSDQLGHLSGLKQDDVAERLGSGFGSCVDIKFGREREASW